MSPEEGGRAQRREDGRRGGRMGADEGDGAQRRKDEKIRERTST